MMRRICYMVLMLPLLWPAWAFAAEPQVTVELNEAEAAEGKCRLTFVIENKTAAAIDSLKLDLVVFNRDNRVANRLLTEMGPLSPSKTVVKTYAVNGACTDIKSILVNEVAACSPGKREDCEEGLALSSRIENVRFYK